VFVFGRLCRIPCRNPLERSRRLPRARARPRRGSPRLRPGRRWIAPTRGTSEGRRGAKRPLRRARTRVDRPLRGHARRARCARPNPRDRGRRRRERACLRLGCRGRRGRRERRYRPPARATARARSKPTGLLRASRRAGPPRDEAAAAAVGASRNREESSAPAWEAPPTASSRPVASRDARLGPPPPRARATPWCTRDRDCGGGCREEQLRRRTEGLCCLNRYNENGDSDHD